MNLLSGLKWFAILGIITALGASIKIGVNYHLDQIDKAVNNAKLEFAVEKQKALNIRESELKLQAELNKEIIEQELIVERKRVNDLRRMLLIEHDLDRLLQRKPGLILPRVNKGTEDVIKELEDLTK